MKKPARADRVAVRRVEEPQLLDEARAVADERPRAPASVVWNSLPPVAAKPVVALGERERRRLLVAAAGRAVPGTAVRGVNCVPPSDVV